MKNESLFDYVWRDFNGNAIFYFTGEILSKDEHVEYIKYIKQKEREEVKRIPKK